MSDAQLPLAGVTRGVRRDGPSSLRTERAWRTQEAVQILLAWATQARMFEWRIGRLHTGALVLELICSASSREFEDDLTARRFTADHRWRYVARNSIPGPEAEVELAERILEDAIIVAAKELKRRRDVAAFDRGAFR